MAAWHRFMECCQCLKPANVPDVGTEHRANCVDPSLLQWRNLHYAHELCLDGLG